MLLLTMEVQGGEDGQFLSKIVAHQIASSHYFNLKLDSKRLIVLKIRHPTNVYLVPRTRICSYSYRNSLDIFVIVLLSRYLKRDV